MTSEGSKPRLVYVVTASLNLTLIRGQLRYLREAGFDVMVVSGPGRELDDAAAREGAQTVAVPMAREIAPVRDLVSLWRLWCAMRRLRPHITNVSTPKAGLLGGLAAWLSGVPCRVYTLRGLRWETTTGFKRALLRFTERIACRAAHRVICVSPSVREKAVAAGLVPPERATVFGAGSSNGVEESRFAPSADLLRQAAALRQKFSIPAGARAIGCVGRLTRDKGIPELLAAYAHLRGPFPDARLLLVGDYEEGDPLPPEMREQLESDPQILRTGFIQNVVPWYYVMDVLALPTHREGFPNAVLEAHATGKPVVAARTTGTIDAVVDRITGILVPVGDTAALAAALARLLTDKTLAARMGRAGLERVRREFRPEQIWNALVQEYTQLLRQKHLPLPEPCAEFSTARGAAKTLVASP